MNNLGKYTLAFLMATSVGLNGRPGQVGVIVVDIQADFVQLPVKDPRTLQKISDQGALAVGGDLKDKNVPHTDQKYINAAEKATDTFREYKLPIFFTQDWHPVGHVSFASTWEKKGYVVQTLQKFPVEKPHIDDKAYNVIGQMMWPDHCVQGSAGARILLKVQPQDIVIQKGTDVFNDSYSGFEDKGGKKTPLADELHKKGLTDLIVYGIATDYCVHDTMKDGLNAGFGVHFIINLSRGINAPAGSMLDKIAQLQKKQGLFVYYIKDINDGTKLSDYQNADIDIIVCTNIANFMDQVHKNMRSGELEAVRQGEAMSKRFGERRRKAKKMSKKIITTNDEFTALPTLKELEFPTTREQELENKAAEYYAKKREQATEEVTQKDINFSDIYPGDRSQVSLTETPEQFESEMKTLAAGKPGSLTNPYPFTEDPPQGWYFTGSRSTAAPHHIALRNPKTDEIAYMQQAQQESR